VSITLFLLNSFARWTEGLHGSAMKTDNFSAYVDTCQSIIPAVSWDPGITDSVISDPGIEKRDPGLQSLPMTERYSDLLAYLLSLAKPFLLYGPWPVPKPINHTVTRL